MLSKARCVAFSSVVLLIATAGAASAATDVVTTLTGEKIVGEIKKVEKDVLTIETAYSDADFKIEWDKIASLESDRQFLVETFDGRRLAGSLKVDPATPKTVAHRQRQRAAGRRLRDRALRAIVLVPVRRGLRFRLQHDAGELGHTAHAGRHPAVPRQAGRGHGNDQRVQEHAVERAGHAALGLRERLQVSLRQPLVRQHDPGFREQRRTETRSADDDRRRRRTVPASLGVAVSGARRRSRVDE